MGQVTMNTDEFASLISTLSILKRENDFLKKKVKRMEKLMPPTEQEVDTDNIVVPDSFSNNLAKEQESADPPVPMEKNSLAGKINDIDFGARKPSNE